MSITFEEILAKNVPVEEKLFMAAKTYPMEVHEAYDIMKNLVGTPVYVIDTLEAVKFTPGVRVCVAVVATLTKTLAAMIGDSARFKEVLYKQPIDWLVSPSFTNAGLAVVSTSWLMSVFMLAATSGALVIVIVFVALSMVLLEKTMELAAVTTSDRRTRLLAPLMARTVLALFTTRAAGMMTVLAPALSVIADVAVRSRFGSPAIDAIVREPRLSVPRLSVPMTA